MDSLFNIILIIVGIALVGIFVFWSKWFIEIKYQFPENNDLQISIFFYKWCVLRKKNVRIPNQHELEKEYLHFHTDLWRTQFRVLKEMRLQSLLKGMKVHEFKWQTKGGTGNAFTTSLASGIIWTLKANFIGYLTQYLPFYKNPQIHVQPDFQSSSLQTSFSCMISLRLGKTMLGILRVLKNKEGRR